MTEKQFFEETIAYYSVDPLNRLCMKDDSSICKYSPKSVGKEGLSEEGKEFAKEFIFDANGKFILE